MEDRRACCDLRTEDKSELDVPAGQGSSNSGTPHQVTGQTARELTTEEQQTLSRQDNKLVSEFKQDKLEKEAQKNWDLFYKRNTTKFYKDRHWTTREFEELNCEKTTNSLKILEVGCGVGNFLFPLLEEYPGIYFYACDFSPRAVQFVKDNELYQEDRCTAFQCDITKDDITSNVPENGLDLVTMIFVLSAIHPEKMVAALKNLAKVLKPGGSVLFRDYGLHDYAQLRFAPGHKLQDNLYVRQDGTRAYYFSIETLSELFINAGYKVLDCHYVHRDTVNKKEGLSVPRIFVQGKFQRIPQEDSQS
ncbi:tRNA N(3)-methylcytidine methyltransferase METTL6-like [Lineus longissimus]|uniref:tRNA N(3)-methylcytidine methyltransferase METTL6-like n=1 Tax=Lineus longissimus TaxID=88925 RepID=UPI002B4FA341